MYHNSSPALSDIQHFKEQNLQIKIQTSQPDEIQLDHVLTATDV
jgi:hypothetical protein